MLGKNIARLRRAAGLSQEELAERLSVSRQAVSKWESGQAQPELTRLTAMARLFGVTLDALTGSEGSAEDEAGAAAAVKPPPADEAAADSPQAGVSATGTPAALPRRRTGRWAALLTAFVLGFASARLLPSPAAVSPQPAAESPIPQEAFLPGIREQRAAVFDFAARWRLDYVPFFPEGEPPGEAQDYLFFVFALGLDSWGEEKGRMSTAVVEEVVRRHFERRNLVHGPMPKAWALEGDTYVAIPSGIKELPLTVLRSFSCEQREGRPVIELTVDFVTQERLIPDDAERQDIRRRIAEGDERLLTVLSSERFLLTTDEAGRPVFLAHELLDSGTEGR